MNDLHMDLKVCEGCGALWVRAGAAEGVYCRNCLAKLADFPVARGRRKPLNKTRVRCADVDQKRTFRVIEGGAR